MKLRKFLVVLGLMTLVPSAWAISMLRVSSEVQSLTRNHPNSDCPTKPRDILSGGGADGGGEALWLGGLDGFRVSVCSADNQGLTTANVDVYYLDDTKTCSDAGWAFNSGLSERMRSGILDGGSKCWVSEDYETRGQYGWAFFASRASTVLFDDGGNTVRVKAEGSYHR